MFFPVDLTTGTELGRIDHDTKVDWIEVRVFPSSLGDFNKFKFITSILKYVYFICSSTKQDEN